MAAYERAVRPALHTLGPAVAEPPLPGGRTADLLVGRTIVEIKTAWLTDRNDHENLIDQMLSYGLLSQLTDQPATQVATYLARYQTLLTYPLRRLVQHSAGESIDVLDTARTHLRFLYTSREAAQLAERGPVCVNALQNWDLAHFS